MVRLDAWIGSVSVEQHGPATQGLPADPQLPRDSPRLRAVEIRSIRSNRTRVR